MSAITKEDDEIFRSKAQKLLKLAKENELPCTKVMYRGAVFSTKKCIPEEEFLQQIIERFQNDAEHLKTKNKQY